MQLTREGVMRIFTIWVVLAIMCSGTCLAENYDLPAGPRFESARTSFEKAMDYEKRGDRAFRAKPGLAQKMYEHAEDYVLKAEFIYKELGDRSGDDVSRYIAECRRYYRSLHVKVNDARKKARHR